MLQMMDFSVSHQVKPVSFYPLFPSAVGLLPLLNAHQLVSIPGNQRLSAAHEQTQFNGSFLYAGS